MRRARVRTRILIQTTKNDRLSNHILPRCSFRRGFRNYTRRRVYRRRLNHGAHRVIRFQIHLRGRLRGDHGDQREAAVQFHAR